MFGVFTTPARIRTWDLRIRNPLENPPKSSHNYLSNNILTENSDMGDFNNSAIHSAKCLQERPDLAEIMQTWDLLSEDERKQIMRVIRH